SRITLSDRGHGIDEVTIQKIFEPFFTTKDIGKGTGLGLSVVYGIVSQHNGYILVTSEVGHGTTFDLYFPLVEQQDAKATDPLTSAGPTTGDETILLADDDPTLLGMFSEILSEKGYSVITATDGVDAVEKFAASPDSFDLLVLDVQMRWKSGLQAFKEIKQIRPECRALFVSGFNEEQFCDDMELEEGSELLTKPFKPLDLAVRVRKMLDDIKLSNSPQLS
ncbi:MAG: response regulator, partial [Deltaproteobacteria bacterium]|nr:response regulator [Deltaproteobacteria bacterium]